MGGGALQQHHEGRGQISANGNVERPPHPLPVAMATTVVERRPSFRLLTSSQAEHTVTVLATPREQLNLEMLLILTVEERAKIAARYEVWGSLMRVQRWWRAERRIHATLDAKTVENCHSKLLTTGSVADARQTGRQSTSGTAENVDRAREMFIRSPKKSLHQGSCESGYLRYSVATILEKDLSFKPWKPRDP